MARVVNTNSPGKRRNQNMRACAELLRRLSQKTEMDADAHDMVAALYLELKQIDDSIDEAVAAWEKRDYWIKAEQFRQKWTWVGLNAEMLLELIKAGDWNKLPALLVQLLPHFAEIKINKFTRNEDLWQGKYNQLINSLP